jgi:hypothetical protein
LLVNEIPKFQGWHLGLSGAMTQSNGVWGAAWTSLCVHWTVCILSLDFHHGGEDCMAFLCNRGIIGDCQHSSKDLKNIYREDSKVNFVCESLIQLPDLKTSMGHVMGKGYCYFRSFWSLCTFYHMYICTSILNIREKIGKNASISWMQRPLALLAYKSVPSRLVSSLVPIGSFAKS